MVHVGGALRPLLTRTAGCMAPCGARWQQRAGGQGTRQALPTRRIAVARRRRVAAFALDGASLGGLIDGAESLGGAALDALLGGVPAAHAAETVQLAAGGGVGEGGLELLSFGATAAVAAGAPLVFSLTRRNRCACACGTCVRRSASCADRRPPTADRRPPTAMPRTA